jgi:hypothetical protein
MADIGIMALGAGGLNIAPLSGSPVTTIPGIGWPTKTPIMQTRIQRAVSGRELRAQDYPYPLWQFELPFNFLRDHWDGRGNGIAAAGNYDELRTLFGFYLACGGAFGTFLFDDPSDDFATGAALPAAVSTLTGAAVAAAGGGYNVGDKLAPTGGSPPVAAALAVTSVGGGGAITGLSVTLGGVYNTVPGSTGVGLTSVTGSGSGATANLTWSTTTQLQRQLGTAPAFIEPIVAPNSVSAIYYNGINQADAGWTVNAANGVVTLPVPFTAAQPAITADFSYRFRCRFVDDSYSFEGLMLQLWQIKKLSFISVRP